MISSGEPDEALLCIHLGPPVLWLLCRRPGPRDRGPSRMEAQVRGETLARGRCQIGK
jgi:hypothetical protein